ncbi:interleukin-4 [Heterocephalus glaber]|uniref:Interleukin-4 n=1 Tax=Heterocephalus glaber TaxID=10181 RepID=A0AAX6RAB3_HETGA|nr:interleukin-4 [Heterocephalus glaber]
MGLVPQLTVTLFCLLACTGTFVRGCNDALQEIINDLNVLSSQKTPCAELAAADVFAAPKVRGCSLVFLGRWAAWGGGILQHLNKKLSTVVANFGMRAADTAEKLCQAVTVLHRTSYLGVGLSCLNRHRESVFLVLLKKVYRNLRSMVQPNCSVSELKQTTLKDFLENLKTILKKKYSEC